MDTEKARELLLKLPHVCETKQWGENLVFWVGDKAIGGKMFALLNLDPTGGVMSFAAGEEGFHELVERDGIIPAPYMARIFWVAAEGWNALRNAEWEQLLRKAHEITLSKLPPRTRDVLAMPVKAREKLIRERRTLLEKRAALDKAVKAKKKATAKKKR
jgi:predicted DNA-binding protein (MmcQ/YjbR family)